MAILAALLTALSAAARTDAATPRYSLTVEPARIVVSAGQAGTPQIVKVSNTGSGPLHVDVVRTAFTQQRDGHLVFAKDAPFSASEWIQAEPAAFDLPPGAHEQVRVTIDVPPFADPGEHQVALIFRVPAARDTGGFAVSGGIGSIVLVGVPGIVTHSVAIRTLQAPLVADSGKVRLKLKIRNSGSVRRDYIRPHRLVAIIDGKRVPFPDFTVLRNSTREVETEWTDPPLFCVCTARVTTDDGHGNPVTVTARVFIFPFRVVGGILIAAVGLGLLFWTLRRRAKERTEARFELARQEGYLQARSELDGPT